MFYVLCVLKKMMLIFHYVMQSSYFYTSMYEKMKFK